MPEIPRQKPLKITKAMLDEDLAGQIERNAKLEIQQLRMELKLYGFAAVKRIAQLEDRTSGKMECPLCGQPLTFSIAATNGHCAARCTRKGCIRMME